MMYNYLPIVHMSLYLLEAPRSIDSPWWFPSVCNMIALLLYTAAAAMRFYSTWPNMIRKGIAAEAFRYNSPSLELRRADAAVASAVVSNYDWI